MPIYIVIPLTEDSSKLDDAVRSKIDEHSRHPLQAGRGWLVQFPGTTTEVSAALGVANMDRTILPETDSAIIVPVPNYFGRGPSEMWEWLYTRMDK